MCVFFSHSFWTSSSLDVPAGVTQEEGHTEFLIHLLSAVRALIFSREGFSHSFPSSTVKSNFVLCTNDLIVLHPLGIFILFFSFLVRKIPYVHVNPRKYIFSIFLSYTSTPKKVAHRRGPQKKNHVRTSALKKKMHMEGSSTSPAQAYSIWPVMSVK